MQSKDNPSSSKKSGDSVKEFMKKCRQTKGQEGMADIYVEDDYANAGSVDKSVRLPTGIIYSDENLKHRCDWDPHYPECPERYTSIMERINELDLVKRCKMIPTSANISAGTLKQVHVPLMVELLKAHCSENVEERERISSLYDAIYINKDTEMCARLACDQTISLLQAVDNGEVQNGMAIIRPPGHHAQKAFYNGYCFFNNVAVAVKHLSPKRVLIVDFDVHHGQGTQQIFYESRNVLYFSIHRYEFGKFWPNLEESNFNYIGDKLGSGYNINVPLNATGLTDSDYMAIILHILMPVAYEFQPELVVFSAGYDACVGCPEGEMNVTPAFYSHLIKLLSGLAKGKLAVILEGGYFLPSLAEGVAMTLRALLDDRSVPLLAMSEPHMEVREVINNLKRTLCLYWRCFSVIKLHTDLPKDAECGLHTVTPPVYLGTPCKPPFDTRDCYPVQSSETVVRFTNLIGELKEQYGNPVPNKVCYAYHEDMLLHKTETQVVENPQRLKDVMEKFIELGLNRRCTNVYNDKVDPISLAKTVHESSYIDKLLKDDFRPDENKGDIFWNKDSLKSIKSAISALISVVDAVMKENYSSGLALIRPPGHHAEYNQYMGFCFVNNVAVAAQYLLDNYDMNRVMIIDFDIHHGNGTQNIFYKTNKVFYVSIHKYESGQFFPGTPEAAFDRVGEGEGRGYNMNIPFDRIRLTDIDYLYILFNLIIPICYSYAPEFIIVSAGFDAGINDLLGNYKVSPEGFAHMVQILRAVSGGRLLLAMEGGYNITTLKTSMSLCAKALLGDPIPKIKKSLLDPETRNIVDKVIWNHRNYWPVLTTDKMLAN